ncbi:MAG: septum formation initiator family protein [Bacteroidetes bacterium]|nr:septum formation initiator family protein [Bacteroidota bacterium]
MNFRSILRFLLNRYTLATLIFLVLIIFLDRDSLLNRLKLHRELKGVEQEKQFLEDEIAKDKQSIHLLSTDSVEQERYAREVHRMKKDSEDIYLIVRKKKQ